MRSLILMLLLISCQNKESQNLATTTKSSIINGEKATAAEHQDLFYSAVSVLMDNGNLCSGVLISSNVVLTAGHCFFKKSNSIVIVSTITPIRADATTENAYEVDKVISHPSFVKSNADLAIIILKKNVEEPHKPMQLLDGIEFAKYNEPVHIAGFSPFSTPLRKDIFDFLSDEGIKAEYVYSNLDKESRTSNLLVKNAIMANSELTAENDYINLIQLTGGLCSGDSGGPTMVKRGENLYLVGINRSTSSFTDELSCEHNAQATSVAIYKDWIIKTIIENNAELPIFATPQESTDEKELACSTQLTEIFQIYSNVYDSFRFSLKDRDLPADLSSLSHKCFEACAGVKGFKGFCEYFDRGASKLIDYQMSKAVL